jgi:cytochrome c-type biogenesis protein
MTDINIFAAFFAGFLTFILPCTFPLIPSYLSLISGLSISEIKNEKVERRKIVRKILINGALFVSGFTIVFVSLGTLAAFLSLRLFAQSQEIMSFLGGLLIIIFGFILILNTTGKLPLFSRSIKLDFSQYTQQGGPLASFLVGFSFAFGWTPCVGPLVGSILTLAGDRSTVLQGGFLLLVFSLGLAIPFMITALAYALAFERVHKKFRSINKYLTIFELMGGVILVLLGILLLTDNFTLLIQYAYEFSDWIADNTFIRFRLDDFVSDYL